MADPLPFLEQAQRLGLSLAIGFLVGVERGWKQRTSAEGERVAGLRTFALTGLLGGLVGLLAPLSVGVAAAIALVFPAGFVAFQLARASAGDNSATSAIAGLVVFGVGVYATLGDPILAAAAGVAVAAILAFKQGLHAWLGSITWAEIRSAILILVATFIILPFLPAGAVDPWGVFDPRSLWLLTIAIAIAGFGGYVALRVLGPGIGLAASALIGGLVSSTAVTLDLARRVQASEINANAAAAGASLAAMASITRAVAVASLLAPGLLGLLWAPLLAALAVLAVATFVLAQTRQAAPTSSGFATIRSPLDIVSVARFAAVLSVLTVAANLSNRIFGHAGLNAFAATAGLVDVDAVALAMGNLVAQDLSLSRAAEALGLAIASNQLFKVVVAASSGSVGLAWRFGVAALAAAAAAAGAFLTLGPA